MLIEEFKQIKYDKEENGILTVTLNWPMKKNALSPLCLLELWYAIDHAEKDNEVKAMILTGCEEAGAFSSGGYFSNEMLKEIPEKYRAEINLRDMASKKLCLKFWDFSKPVISVINGFAVGGGFTLPVICLILFRSNKNILSEPSKIGITNATPIIMKINPITIEYLLMRTKILLGLSFIFFFLA